MNAWSNIQTSPQDPEIIKINNLEKKMRELPIEVLKIRELITRFEICHFKYQQHLQKIKDSIVDLEPKVDTTQIGANHIQHGENVLYKDVTGKSFIGQQYIWALKKWLNDDPNIRIPDNFDKKTGQKVQELLGKRNPDKIRLVKLLIARLTWDWESYENLQYGGGFEDIEYQICRMDICHYAFHENLNLLLKGIGKMKPLDHKEFEGCGSYTDEIKDFLENEFLELNNKLQSMKAENQSREDMIRVWLFACLAKTIKENINISIPIIGL